MKPLLEEINEVLNSLQEEAKSPYDAVIRTAKTLDPSIDKTIPWSNMDDKWNQLITAAKNKNFTVVKAEDAALADNVYYRDTRTKLQNCYVKWDEQAKTATFTSIDDATPYTENKRELLAQLPDWLAKDPNTKNVTYKRLVVVPTKEEQATQEDVIAYYFQKVTGINYENNVPEYWRRAIRDDVNSNSNITNSKMLQFVAVALRTEFNGSPLMTILRDNKISRVVFTLIENNQLTTNMLGKIDSYFMLAALFSGCFSSLNYNDILNSFASFTRIKKAYMETTNFLIPEIKRFINPDGERAKEVQATIFTENVLFYKTNGGIESNILYMDATNPPADIEDGKVNPDGIINPISVTDLPQYTAASKAEVKSLLDIVLNEEFLQKQEQFWLVVGNNKYALLADKKKLVTTDEQIIFEKNKIIKVCYSISEQTDLVKNRFTVNTNDLNTVVESKIKEFNVANWIKIDAEHKCLAVNKENFKLTGKSLVTFELDDNGNISKMILSGDAGLVDESELKANDTTTNTENTNTADNKEYVEAIIKYLIQNKTKELDTDDKVKKFMLTPNSQSKYELIKQAAIKELAANPAKYLYDTTNKEIKDVAGTMLEVLISLLNDDPVKAQEQYNQNKPPKTGSNISPNITLKPYMRVPKLTASQIADKLKSLEDILRADRVNANDKLDSKVRRELMSDDNKKSLEDLITWFNNRFDSHQKVTKEEN